MKKLIILIIVFAGLGFAGWRVWQANKNDLQLNSTNPKQSKPSPVVPSTSGFDKTKYSISEANSLWRVVNKARPLPDSYKPDDLVVPNVKLRLAKSVEQMHVSKKMQPDLEKMFIGAKVAGYDLMLASGFRSQAYQKQLYDSYVAKDGQVAADRYSARPGTSEHQTGLAVDVGRIDQKCELEICFGATEEGKWVAKNAAIYGFIIRYQDGKESITTYQYEPWHLRYIGIELAQELTKTDQTMEEFFNL
ncbi:MAG: M15 family metallopeptidase [Patescibacteria group bacterium]